MPDILFYRSLRKLYLLISACLLLCALGAFLMLGMDGYTITWLGLGISARTVGIGIIALFGLGAIGLAAKTRDKRPALTITRTAIIDQTSMTAAGEIPLAEIRAVHTIQAAGQTLILLLVRDPAFFIDRETSGLRRRILMQSLKAHGTPIVLSGAFLDGGTTEVLRSIQQAVAGRAETSL